MPTECGRVVVVAESPERSVGRPPVGHKSTSRIDGLFRETLEAQGRDRCQTLEADSSNTSAADFRGNGNGNLVWFSTTTSFDAADECFVDLHVAAKALPSGSNHGASKFVQTSPSRFITSQAQQSLKAQGADTILLVGEPPRRTKPYSQGQAGTMEDRSGGNRNILTASGAVQEKPSA